MHSSPALPHRCSTELPTPPSPRNTWRANTRNMGVVDSVAAEREAGGQSRDGCRGPPPSKIARLVAASPRGRDRQGTSSLVAGGWGLPPAPPTVEAQTVVVGGPQRPSVRRKASRLNHRDDCHSVAGFGPHSRIDLRADPSAKQIRLSAHHPVDTFGPLGVKAAAANSSAWPRVMRRGRPHDQAVGQTLRAA